MTRPLLFLVLVVGCRARPVPGTVDAAAGPAVLVDAEVGVTPAPPLPAPPPRKLRLVKAPERCKVVDDATGAVVGRATNADTAAGGGEPECAGFDLEGQVILFANNRGTYAKDGRLGKTNDRPLPCGGGVYASDLTSCILLDLPAFVRAGPADAEDMPFDLELCPITHPPAAECTTLATIRRGGNRTANAPRTWDATYCDDAHVVAVANGELRLVTAPRGKVVARAPAPKLTRVTCADGIATVSGGSTTRRFRVTESALRAEEETDGGR